MKIPRFILILFALSLTACSSSDQANQPLNLADRPAENRTTDRRDPSAPTIRSQSKIADGEYPVQQATFDDADGQYTLMLLNAPSSSFRTQKLQMARLTDEQIKEGKKSYLKVENQEPIFYLTEDFKIAYVHNVAEERQNPTTGQTETTIVRQESSFWSPFAGSLAGGLASQAIGNMLFRPQYYVPPQFQSGGVMSGYGGYGSTYGGAVNSYQQRYQQPPAVERNRTTFRSNGSIRTNRDRTKLQQPPNTTNRDRSTGSGFGSSNLKKGQGTVTRKSTQRSSGSFGSGRSSRSSGSFGSSRRR